MNKCICEILCEGPHTLDELSEETGISVAELSGRLLRLELKKMICRRPGAVFEMAGETEKTATRPEQTLVEEKSEGGKGPVMKPILSISRSTLKDYPRSGAVPLEVLGLFKVQFPDRAELDTIQGLIIGLDAVFRQADYLADQEPMLRVELDAVRRLLKKAPGNEVLQAEQSELVRRKQMIVEQKAKLLDSIDWQAVAITRQHLIQMAVELAVCGLVELREYY